MELRGIVKGNSMSFDISGFTPQQISELSVRFTTDSPIEKGVNVIKNIKLVDNETGEAILDNIKTFKTNDCEDLGEFACT